MVEQRKIQELRQGLERERDEIRKTMEMPGQVKLTDDLDNPDQGDLALQYSSIESTSVVRETLEDRLNAIEEALRRIEDGTYGRCVECGNEISAERLESEPAAVLCADCAQHENR
jgi:DnaK suppressor protein